MPKSQDMTVAVPDEIVRLNRKIKYAIYDLSQHVDKNNKLEDQYHKLNEKLGTAYAQTCHKYKPEMLERLNLDPKSPSTFVILNNKYKDMPDKIKKLLSYHEEGHVVAQQITRLESVNNYLEMEADIYALKKLQVKTVEDALGYAALLIKGNINPSWVWDVVKAAYRLYELKEIK